MRAFLRFLKGIRAFNAVRRFGRASTYYNSKYLQIFKWTIQSKEDTNYTYFITDDSKLNIANAVAIATNAPVEQVIQYMEEAEGDIELKDQILKATKASDLTNFSDNEVRYGRRLGWYAAVRVMKAKVVIETGIDKGLGSVLLSSAILRNQAEGHPGRYYGTDINLKAGYLLSGKYKESGEILYGDSIESLKEFKQEIDLFINDSDHSADYEYNEYITIKHLLSKKGIILGDNSHCTDKLAKFSMEEGRHFLFINEVPKNHWYPGAGIGISYPKDK